MALVIYTACQAEVVCLQHLFCVCLLPAPWEFTAKKSFGPSYYTWLPHNILISRCILVHRLSSQHASMRHVPAAPCLRSKTYPKACTYHAPPRCPIDIFVSWIIWGCFLKQRPKAGWDPSNRLWGEISLNLPLSFLKRVTCETETTLFRFG